MARIVSSSCAALLLWIAFVGKAAADAEAELETAAESNAVVVLIGEAARNRELAVVLSELLLRRGVQAQFEAKPSFVPSALLDTGAGDARVWVFVVIEDTARARLYFRGPLGERFLLRELALRDGLDEVGRELVAKVVESSTVALLQSSEGMSRAQAAEGIAREEGSDTGSGSGTGSGTGTGTGTGTDSDSESDADSDADSEPDSDSDSDSGHARDWLLGARLVGQWTGNALGARYGAGVEVGRSVVHGRWLRLRLRVALEANLPQRLERAEVDARILSFPLRAGLDIGAASGAHAVYLGLATGIDLVRTTAQDARDASLTLAKPSTQLLPVSRTELRYEFAFGSGWLSAGLLLDVPWSVTHYDVFENGMHKRLGKPWPVRPGLVLGGGVRW